MKKNNTKSVSYKPVGEVIAAFHKSNAFCRYIQGPFGSGKSVACVMEIFTRAQEQKPDQNGIRKTRWAIIRNDYPTLRETVVKTWCDWVLPEQFGPVKFGSPFTHHIIYKLPDGTTVDCEVLFMSLDEEADEKKLLSLELTGIWFNEASALKRSAFEKAQGRVGRYPPMRDGGCTWSGVILDSNPPDRLHWLYNIFVEIRPEGFAFFQQPSGRSPEAENIKNLPVDYYKKLAAGKKDSWIRAFVDGEFAYSLGGMPVHETFNPQLHVLDHNVEPQRNLRLYVGLDFGLTPAAAFMTYNPAKHQYIIHDEITTRRSNAREIAEDIHRMLRANYEGMVPRFGADPAGGQGSQTDGKTVFEIFQALGIDAEPARTNSFSIRQNAVDNLLSTIGVTGQPAIMINPRCHVIISGLSGAYKFRLLRLPGNSDQYRADPDKTFESHIVEAVHYGLMIAGEGEALLRQSGITRASRGPKPCVVNSRGRRQATSYPD